MNKMKIKHEKSDSRNLIYSTRVHRVHVYIDTNPGWLEIPLTRINFMIPAFTSLSAVNQCNPVCLKAESWVNLQCRGVLQFG